MLGEVPAFFPVERFSVNVERRYNAVGELVMASEAIVKVRVGDEVLISAAEGNGPVNALDVALRKDLGKYQDLIQELELTDYKVRIYPGRFGRGDARADRIHRRRRRKLDDHRRVSQHHRRVVPGAHGFDRLQTFEKRRGGVIGSRWAAIQTFFSSVSLGWMPNACLYAAANCPMWLKPHCTAISVTFVVVGSASRSGHEPARDARSAGMPSGWCF